MESDARMIVIRSGDTREEMAQIFLASCHRVQGFLREHDPPFIARLYRNSIEMWLNRGDWTPR